MLLLESVRQIISRLVHLIDSSVKEVLSLIRSVNTLYWYDYFEYLQNIYFKCVNLRESSLKKQFREDQRRFN